MIWSDKVRVNELLVATIYRWRRRSIDELRSQLRTEGQQCSNGVARRKMFFVALILLDTIVRDRARDSSGKWLVVGGPGNKCAGGHGANQIRS